MFSSAPSLGLEHRIGHGRQGVVFKGVRHGARSCRTCHALKLFDPAIYESPDEYWSDMGRISTQVADLHMNQSPHLLGCDFYEEESSIGYIQMELIEGVNLHELLDPRLVANRLRTPKGPGPLFNVFEGRPVIQPGVVVYIMRQMLEGIEALHSAGYLHCDVKPANVMIDSRGYIRIIDLGRAVRVNEGHGRLLGTPRYSAPEVHRGAPVTVKSDVYGVGIVGLELLRGAQWTSARKLSITRLLELKENLANRLESLLPPYVCCNHELMAILRRLLDPDPAGRFADARTAEAGAEGLAVVHKQLTRMDIDSDYRRVLADVTGSVRLETS